MEKHVSVLRDEAVDALRVQNGSVIVDATLGSGGHAEAIIDRLGTEGTYIGIDADNEATEAFIAKHGARERVQVCTHNFRDIGEMMPALGFHEVNGILADLGWRMEQFSGNGKGFSFLVDEPLIMTYGDPKQYPFTARDIVNEWKEEDLRNVLKGYGEERFAGRIARRIVAAREMAPIETSGELARLVKEAVPGFWQNRRIHPATQTFQALRIAVNDELEALEEFMESSITLLRSRGRLAIITFHSIEDRIVKHAFKKYEHDQRGKVITKKPITASKEEIAENPRARSAKLRIFEKA